ncbi:ROK family protein [Microbacterium sp. bgisy189]|uniref:ROK family protein n=1 Tax=Microbacterium sp. bgisy189 TaxID=3413798 RepID=UPI003EBC615A
MPVSDADASGRFGVRSPSKYGTSASPAADDATLTAALESSDAGSVGDELARQRRILATALANAVNVLNPALIVLGGFLGDVAGDGDDLTRLVRAKAMHANGEDLRTRRASLAADRLHIGAAELAFSRVVNDPVDA